MVIDIKSKDTTLILLLPYNITRQYKATQYMYDKRLVTSLIEHEDRVALPIVCKMIDNDSLPRSMSFRL